mmetsp:Transcript_17802/g.60135  ORF Transcript_17802/g.60135 Transcript_17802/m.60135 type:complete len:229 (-) Transcript_17802:410-1096(-)
MSSQGTTGLLSRYEVRTFEQMVRSPVLNEYARDHPCAPKRRRPRTMEWNQQSEKRQALKSSGLVQASIRSWLKLAHARTKLDLISAGASLATLTEACISDSGMFFAPGSAGGGSADKKQRKSGCAFSWTTSSNRSKFGTQDVIKWQFCSITQPPVFAKRSSTASAGFSCPWPMEMLQKVPASVEMPLSLPKPSTQGVGSTPGNKTKKTGVWFVVSSYVAGMSNGCWKT